ncbi:glutathione peroxidase 7 isoform X2 [Gopherus flavomarginatus]|uniref:glutathione peroxidase 7 isoform X2 n=1 Tax=Gopherus flavomarginatus TaxID=286002 RepID=UPI0021CBBDAA|nr:glutathione peroxidase 7 isoform X2 [Gopherus flavomarginatus]
MSIPGNRILSGHCVKQRRYQILRARVFQSPLQQLSLSGSALACSMLDPEGSVEHRASSSFSRVFFIPLAMVLAVATLLFLAFAASQQKENDFYTFKMVNIRGKLVSLEKYRGSVSLVVNVASECGFTDSHYKALQQLQRDLGSQHFNVLAFPCNQFGQQEPDSNKEIESFARKTYGATFPMFSKIAVTGAGANAAFKYLIESTGEEPTWNFWKYLVAPNGKVVKAWDSTVTIQEIKPYITELLRKILLKQKDEL